VLEQMSRRRSLARGLSERAQIVLRMSEGIDNSEISRKMNLNRETVRTWRARWLSSSSRIEAVEVANGGDKALTKVIREVLSDEPRSGAPAKFTPEQIVQVVAVACEKPTDSGRPISHWTPREVADEVVKRGIVASISVRQCGRFLKSGGFKTPPNRVLAEPKAGRPGRIHQRGRSDL
jgi:putative transposase